MFENGNATVVIVILVIHIPTGRFVMAHLLSPKRASLGVDRIWTLGVPRLLQKMALIHYLIINKIFRGLTSNMAASVYYATLLWKVL